MKLANAASTYPEVVVQSSFVVEGRYPLLLKGGGGGGGGPPGRLVANTVRHLSEVLQRPSPHSLCSSYTN